MPVCSSTVARIDSRKSSECDGSWWNITDLAGLTERRNVERSSMLEWPQPTRTRYSSGVYCASWNSRSAPRRVGAGIRREAELVVGDVRERASRFLEPVAERRSRVGDARGGDREPVELPRLLAELDELDLRRQLVETAREERRRQVAGDPLGERRALLRRPPDRDRAACGEERRKEPEPFDVVEVQVRKEQVDALGSLPQRDAEWADPRPGIQDHEPARLRTQLDGGGVPPVPHRALAGCRERPPAAPDGRPHESC